MSHNTREMEQYLKDANLYEENMSDEQVASFYNAIKESEISAAEIQDKSMNESVNELLSAMNESEKLNTLSVKDRLKNEANKIFTPKQWSTDKKKNILSTVKETANQESNNNNNNKNEKQINIISNDQENRQPSHSKVILNDDDLFGSIGKNEPNKADEHSIIFEKLKTSNVRIQPIKTDNSKLNIHIGFNDMSPDVYVEKNMLKILSHELKMINIQNSNKFLSANNETRIKMLVEYHIASEKLRAQIARLSRTMAPLPKPITSTDSSTTMTSGGGSQDQKSPVHQTISALREEEGFVEFVSRSGRHTKRKIYCEEDSQEESTSTPKKSKTIANNNEDWLSKNQTLKVAKIPLARKSDTVSSTTNNNNAKDFIVEETDENKPKQPRGRPKQPAIKKLSNNEIMQRCSLFGDSPGRRRAGAMVTAGIEEENRRKKEAEKMEEFNKSLQVNTEEDEEENTGNVISVDEDRTEVEEVTFERKRVIPPVPLIGGRKPINNRKRKEDGTGVEALGITTTKKITSNISSSSDEFETQPVNGNGSNNNNTANSRRGIGRSNSTTNVERSEASSSTSKGGRGGKPENMVTCPLCSLPFPKKNIEEHAATCGEELVTQSTPRNTRITCPECDLVIVNDYQDHVNNCKRQRNSK